MHRSPRSKSRPRTPQMIASEVCDAQSDLRLKLVSADQALAAIEPGSRIYLGTGCAAPRALLARLEAMQPGPSDLEFVSFLTTSAVLGETAVSATRYRHRTFFVGSDVRALAVS